MLGKIIYSVIETPMQSECIGGYIGFGIDVKELSPTGETLIRRVCDISEIREFAEKIARLMNEGGLASEHVDDVLQNMVGTKEFCCL